MESGPDRPLFIVDVANVMGSRPDGWWRDRSGAAARLVRQIGDALRSGALEGPLALVLEGSARCGVVEDATTGALRVVHAPASGDDRIVDATAAAMTEGASVVVVTADRQLRQRVQALGAEVASPRWLLDRLPGPPHISSS